MSITADTVRAARAHLDRFGLRQDGEYGTLNAACCAMGAAAIADLTRRARFAREPDAIVEHDYITDRVLTYQRVIDNAWWEWMQSEGNNPTVYADGLIDWNDRDATAEDVRRFYDWWAAELDAEGPVPA